MIVNFASQAGIRMRGDGVDPWHRIPGVGSLLLPGNFVNYPHQQPSHSSRSMCATHSERFMHVSRKWSRFHLRFLSDSSQEFPLSPNFATEALFPRQLSNCFRLPSPPSTLIDIMSFALRARRMRSAVSLSSCIFNDLFIQSHYKRSNDCAKYHM